MDSLLSYIIQILLVLLGLFALFSLLIVAGILAQAGKQSMKSSHKKSTVHRAKLDTDGEAQEKRTKEKPQPWEKHKEMKRFEILYWRGVAKPWWWNNYAEELIEYAKEYLPVNKLDEFEVYNSNSRSEDYKKYTQRIDHLKPYKLSKHPLVVINYDEEFIMVASKSDLDKMMDRIDAEWLRHYDIKKTYRKAAWE